MKTETHNETKHTPGPWRTGDAGTTIFGPPTNETAPVIIALNLKPTERVGYHERKANTRLIAAAPELLEALRALVDVICGGDRDVTLEDCDAAKAAIAKAEGK